MVFDEFKRAKTTRFAQFFLQHEVLQRCAMVKWWGVGTGGDGPEARNPRDTPLEGEVARVVLPWHPAFVGMQRELTQSAALFSVHLPI